MQTDFERFRSKVAKAKKNECWLWTKAIQKDGYGIFKFRGKTFLAHRAAWIIAKGEIPQGMEVLHSCDNPPCCNLSHLFLGTQLENIHDRHSKDRDGHTMGRKGSSNSMSVLSESDVIHIRQLAMNNIAQRTIAKKFHVSEASVSNIIHRKTWTHV